MKRLAIRNYTASVEFVNNSSFINIPNTANLTPGTSSFGMAFWYRPTAFNLAASSVLAEMNAGAYSDGWLLNQSSGNNLYNLLVYVKSGGPSATFANFFDFTGLNTWQRIVVTCNATDAKVRAYKNGRLMGTSAAITAWNITATGAVRMGNAIDLSPTPPGNYADVSFFKGTIPTDAQVAAEYYDNVPFSMAVHRYLLNENTGTNLVDSIAGNTATVSGSNWSTNVPMKSRTEVPGVQNLLTYSEQFNVAPWAQAGMIVTANNIANPVDGLITADLITGTATPAAFTRVLLAVSGAPYTYSIFVKAGTNTSTQFALRNNTTAIVLAQRGESEAEGTTTENNGTSTTINYGGGWKKIILTATSGITAGDSLSLYFGQTGGNSDGLTFWLWGAQLTQANWPGPYVKTEAAAVNTGAIRSIVT